MLPVASQRREQQEPNHHTLFLFWSYIHSQSSCLHFNHTARKFPSLRTWAEAREPLPFQRHVAGLQSLSRDMKASLSSLGIESDLGGIRRMEEDEKSKPLVGNHWGRCSGVVVRTTHAVCTRSVFWFKIAAWFFVTGAGNGDCDQITTLVTK